MSGISQKGPLDMPRLRSPFGNLNPLTRETKDGKQSAICCGPFSSGFSSSTDLSAEATTVPTIKIQ